MSVGRNKKSFVINKLWIAGARVWAEWHLTGGYTLFDFVSYRKEYDTYSFSRRGDGAIMQMNGLELHARLPYFRPFLIDLEKLACDSLVVDKNNKDPYAPKGEPPTNAS